MSDESRLIITDQLLDMAKKGFCHDRKGDRPPSQATYLTGIALLKETGDLVLYFADSSGNNMQFTGLAKVLDALKGLPVERASVRLPAKENAMNPALVLPAEYAQRAVAAMRKMPQMNPDGEKDDMRDVILEALNKVDDQVRIFVEKKREQSNMAKVVAEKKAATAAVPQPAESYVAEAAVEKAGKGQGKGALIG